MCQMAKSLPGFGHSFEPLADLPSPDPQPLSRSHSHSHSHSHSSSRAHPHPTTPSMQPSTAHLPSSTDVVVVGNGPAGILLSLLLTGYEPYYHADPTRPHPDPILHRMLAPSALTESRPRSLHSQIPMIT
ncbi:hypothetical protein BC939DRAFT_329713 [Gamsiella multidivaricata]|uniref:uncharacterized protein n=1 Tax=Gamsiella multidivaricata TaxID=101098 RepID=UPI00221EF589|nr:uncharacterized protein BC939DRAFT_329713 [Gamsiella multidivaricata]KAI7817428.1 hypothetical protein BC939DRAFT_329713 [Gamsiella multidivaricata]